MNGNFSVLLREHQIAVITLIEGTFLYVLLCMLTVLLFIFNKLTHLFCFCFPFLIYPCVVINGFSLPCLPLSVGF